MYFLKQKMNTSINCQVLQCCLVGYDKQIGMLTRQDGTSDRYHGKDTWWRRKWTYARHREVKCGEQRHSKSGFVMPCASQVAKLFTDPILNVNMIVGPIDAIYESGKDELLVVSCTTKKSTRELGLPLGGSLYVHYWSVADQFRSELLLVPRWGIKSFCDLIQKLAQKLNWW